MIMTPVRLEERALIDFSLLAETDFQATWLGLKNSICAYQQIYDKYRQNILDRLEDFKSNLFSEAVVWLFAKREVQLLLNAWKVLNELLLKLRVDALPLPDATFNNEDLTNAGLTYKNIYGDKTMTEGIGRYQIMTDDTKTYTFVLPSEIYRVEGYDDPTKYNPGMASGHEDQYLFRSNTTVGEDTASTTYDMCWYHSAGNVYYDWEYQEVSSYTRECWYYAYKQTPTSSSYTVEYITSEARFTQLQTLYGQMYLCVAKYTCQDVTVNIGFNAFEPDIETYTLKLRKAGEWDMVSGTEKSWYQSTIWYDQVYYASEYCPGLCEQYYRYDTVNQRYIPLELVLSQAELQEAMDTYGTIYAGRFVNVYKDTEITNLMDLIYDVIDWRNVDIANVKCRNCGHIGMTDNPSEFRQHWLICPECGNYNAYAMEFPKIAYTYFIRPLFQYDPKFSWYDIYINNKNIHNELNPKKLWRGRWGHGAAAAWTDEVDDLMYHKSLRDSGWDKGAYNLAGKVCFYLERYNQDNKIIAEDILTLFTEETQAKALFQVGNIWACRHEIIRLLCTQLMKIHQKGVIAQ